MPEAERITITCPLSHMSTKNTIIGVNINLYTAMGLGTDIFVLTRSNNNRGLFPFDLSYARMIITY